MLRRTFCAVSLGAACATVLGIAFAAPTRVGTGHVRIVTTLKSKRACDLAQEIADRARTAAEQLFGTGVTRNGYTVTLYETLAEYQQKDKELTEGKFATNWAFSSWGTKESYLALTPPMERPLLDVIGLSFLMQSQIAHEVGHQLTYYVVPAYRELPDWLAEGIACAVELETMRRAGLVTDFGKAPFYSRRIVLVRNMLADGSWPGAVRIFTDDYGSLDSDRRYAIWSVFVGWLFDAVWKTNGRAAFAELRKVAASTPDVKAKITALFTKKLGKRIDTLDAEFKSYVDTLHPEWDETSRSTEARDGAHLSIAFATSAARCGHVEPAGTNSYALSGTIEFLAGGPGEAQLFVAAASPSNLDSGLLVRFVRGEGVAAVWARAQNEGLPGTTPCLKGGGPVRFEIRVEPERATIVVDGVECMKLATTTPTNGGCYGFGAPQSSGAWWRDVTLTPAK